MSSSLLQGIYLSEAPSPPVTPYPLLYTCIQYTYSHMEGGKGGELTREKARGATVHSWVENTNMTDCISCSINSDKHLPQSPFTGKFLDYDI